VARRTREADELRRVQRTIAGRIWVALIPAVVFLVLLIVFIAENGQQVEVTFFGAKGHLSLALTLLIAAVAGAVVVLLAGTVRIVQLRLATHRHARRERATKSAPGATGHEAQAVEPEGDADGTRP
jgi:uncharacterized integral membrane protein